MVFLLNKMLINNTPNVNMSIILELFKVNS